MSTAGNERGTDAATGLHEPHASSIDARDEAEIAAALGGAVGAHPHATRAGHSTRDLLARIGARIPGQSHEDPDTPAARQRTFVRWLLGSVLIACVALLAGLYWLDPISVTGRQTRFSVVENGGVRQAKLDLMEQLDTPPGVLVLGSSRSMKLNPAEIKRVSGETAFNAGVSGGTTQDMYLYARYAEDLWGDTDQGYPHLVIGVINDVFRVTGTAVLDPRLKRFMPQKEQKRDPLEVTKQLLQLTTLKAAIRSVRRVIDRDGVSALLEPEKGAGRIDAALATTGRQKGNQLENLDSRGMQLFKPGADYSKSVEKRVEAQMTTFVQRSFVADAGYTGADPRGVENLRRTIALANSHGDVPTIWITPYHPSAFKYLPPEYEQRDKRFRAAIKQLQNDPKLKFAFFDLADISTFGGDPQEFHDGIHMTEKNTAKVIAYLDKRGKLTREEARASKTDSD